MAPGAAAPPMPRRRRPGLAGLGSVGRRLLASAAWGLSLAGAGAEDVTLYFGCGCFWHVQYKFIEAEKKILGRDSSDYTTLTGYAGGSPAKSQGAACYNDYAGRGFTEVVKLTVPRSKVVDFARVYWGLFDGIDRVDYMDQGPAYRAAVGIPKGMQSSLLAEIDNSQVGVVTADRLVLRGGQGGDGDTLGKALVWVYDSEKFPFHQAEVYHQFHDDFMPGGQYPQHYNALVNSFLQDCRIRPTGCPGDTAAGKASCSTGAGAQPPADHSQTASKPTGGSGAGAFDKGGSGAQHLVEDTSETTRPGSPDSSAVLSRSLRLEWVGILLLLPHCLLGPFGR